ncbi:hypothetical protein AMTR_s00027p00222730 [Amborella trichopoda]|uniref:RRM domain-containing protein n=1 Tax=Amborella trichopoda TaxID=13333 RepID=W1PSH2_AMBTC|nr:hypothetical protein AMTR_s00027p00222730 [Amborella trichopoda]
MEVRGKVCGVTRSNDNETLYLRNICKTWTKDAVSERLKAYEVDNLVDVHLIDDPSNKGMNRGYAFLEFSCHMDAVTACNKLQKRDVFFGTNINAEVAFARSAVEPDEEVMAQVKSVFLDGLPPTWDEKQVEEHFKKYGEVEKVQLARHMPTAKRKDFGFISFTTRDAALSCIEGVNRDGIEDDGQKVSVKATLRKPLPKRKPSVTGGWRGFFSSFRGRRDTRPQGPGRSYQARPRGERRWDTSYDDRYGDRGRSKYQSGVRESRKEASYVSRTYELRPERDDRHIPGPSYLQDRYRDRYDSLSGTYSSGHQPDYYSDSREGIRSHRLYPEDDYNPRYEQYELREPSGRDYYSFSGSKRPYSSLDGDIVLSRSFSRGSRSREDLEVTRQSHHGVPAYGTYSRFAPEDRYDYGSSTYSSRDSGSQYLSGGGGSRSYY